MRFRIIRRDEVNEIATESIYNNIYIYMYDYNVEQPWKMYNEPRRLVSLYNIGTKKRNKRIYILCIIGI